MVKFLIKISSIIVIIILLLVIYLSFFGIRTEKFNKIIKDEILNINKKINLELKNVNFLLNPFNFTIKVKTQNPIVILDSNQIELEYIKTSISLKSIISREFSIDDMQISSKAIKINDAITFAGFFKRSPELFILDKVVKNGFLVSDIGLNFDKEGKIKDDYEINGFIKNAKLDFLNEYSTENLDFLFKIKNNEYTFKEVKTTFNQIKLSSPFIEIKNDKGLFSVNGKISTKENDIDIKKINNLFNFNYKNLQIEKINFDLNSDFSFNINKKFKLKDLDIKSIVNLKQLYFKNELLDIKSYLPNFKELIKLENHKINIIYNKNNLKFTGNGDVLIEDKKDSLGYDVVKKNNQYTFTTSINIIKNPLKIDFLSYEKKNDIQSLLKINGVYNKDDRINLDLISLKENDNKIIIKNIQLSDKLKILDIDLLELDFYNNNKIKNKINLKKNKNKYIIKGRSFDGSRIINELLDGDNKGSSIFANLNNQIDIKISKTYIDKSVFINDLYGNLNFENNKINFLNLNSIFPNQKKLILTIKTNKNNEKITTFFSDYPKPIVSRYKFIEGFEEGVLDFYSIEKNGKSNSFLTIDNFKVKKVPIFAKLLSLASLQGIADLLTGEGIRFSDFEMKYSNKNGLMTIEEIYAIGPAVSMMMDGYVEDDKLVSLRGTLVPATTINRTIASIPLIGGILVGKKSGEGIFGVSFKIKGPPKNLKTSVNPIKTLTPRFITRTLEKIKKN